MRLERLEINGFKSFSDRAELAFDKGVTAIVGPNGCGKSNVADAITWVMGEQSAKSLRGERMEDVIFSGSDARKPTAAAEVRLRFSGVLKTLTGPAFDTPDTSAAGDNDDNAHAENGHSGNGHANGNGHGNGNGNGHHAPVANGQGGEVPHVLLSGATPDEIIQSIAREVEVTRRLFRSGESEYLIDGRVCRLRDVHDLLMDTGLGAKAYAIIEQGKIGLILSSRPTDRRQLIEEAAGVTKYKARRRAAELKLEAAQQNLTRIDDIVFEVDKQRGTLKRQARKARRYRALRDELRRWEKVLFARRYRLLAETIEAGRARLADAREREAAASAHVAEGDSHFGRVRIELVEAETSATAARESAHAREIAISRQQQQLAFDREQIEMLSARVASIASELGVLDARREPARAAVEARRAAAGAAAAERDQAQETLALDSTACDAAQREIETLEADVEAARSEVFSAINSATALRHSLAHAATQRERVIEALARFDVEAGDVRVQQERVRADRETAANLLGQAQASIDAVRASRAAREVELATARIEHEWRAREVRSREQELAGLAARLASLEELEAARAEYGDAARTVLAQANGHVHQRGAVADYLEVEAGYEKAVEACLGDLLQYVIVEELEQAAAGLELVRNARAGRCGFLIAQPGDSNPQRPEDTAGPDGLVPLASVVRASGPYAPAIRRALGRGWIAAGYADAARLSATVEGFVATRSGELFRGPHLVAGGNPEEARGILETRRAIKDLRERMETERQALASLAEEAAELERSIARATNAIAALHAEHHGHEKAVVGHEGQALRAAEDHSRLTLKEEQLARERRQAEEERDAIDRRQQEAVESVARIEGEQRAADDRLTRAQRRLFEAREGAQELGRRAADAGALHAALVERASALSAEVARMDEGLVELEDRVNALSADRTDTERRIEELRDAIASGEKALDADVAALDDLRAAVRTADETVTSLRAKADELEQAMKASRAALEELRARVAEFEIARATAESDLSHLAQSCVDNVQATLDEVLAEVTAQEAAGEMTPDARVVCAEEPDEDREGEAAEGAEVESAETVAAQQTLSAEEAIARLRGKIDRLGPVNMMAIDQFEELETRHVFLTTQRKDLVDSIAQTSEAIKRIDETTKSRFAEAFNAINHNFQQTFSTLFGGGRAGLTLLDENDPLESGIEIIAQPPGKRLQSVQLLSGGEKALTAIALMFGLFQYKPSPFCLLDEIDAPLDDANIGRFVEMLRGMLRHTQFILITHNRKTMEIADRLYGVTMEEPGVSKLISVQLN